MQFDQKVALFRQGHYSLEQPPKVDTFNWSERKWVNWIDLYGSWKPVAANDSADTKMAYGHSWVYDRSVGKYRLKRTA